MNVSDIILRVDASSKFQLKYRNREGTLLEYHSVEGDRVIFVSIIWNAKTGYHMYAYALKDGDSNYYCGSGPDFPDAAILLSRSVLSKSPEVYRVERKVPYVPNHYKLDPYHKIALEWLR